MREVKIGTRLGIAFYIQNRSLIQAYDISDSDMLGP